MAQACRQCGAPLHAAPVGQALRCDYCGLVAKQPAPVREREHATPSRPGNTAQKLIAVWAIMGTLAAIGAVISVLVFSGGPDPVRVSQPVRSVATTKPPPPPRLSIHWVGSPAGCELDANGDGVSDMAGLSGESGQDPRPTLVDGATGNVLWSGAPTPRQAQFGCLGSEWMFVVAPNFQADFYSARNPGAPVRVLLRDLIDSYGLGAGCAKLKTDDGTTQGVSLPGGVATPCTATLRRYYGGHKPGLIGLTEESTERRVGKRTYSLRKRRSGTNMLTLRIEDGGKLVWTKELPYAAPTFSTGLAVAEGVVVLWAAKPGALDRGMLIGFDEATGEQLYEKAASSFVSNDIGFMSFNGRYVVVQSWVTLYAFEPKTGQQVWAIGR